MGEVELLGQGAYFLAYGIHPKTQAPYTWAGASPCNLAVGDLPHVQLEQVERFHKAFLLLKHDDAYIKTNSHSNYEPMTRDQEHVLRKIRHSKGMIGT